MINYLKTAFITTCCVLLINSLRAQQGHMVIKDNAFVVLNTAVRTDSVFVVVDNPSDAAVSTSGTGGNLITKHEKNYLKWNIGTNTGSYNVPFTAAPTATNTSSNKTMLSNTLLGNTCSTILD